MSILLYNSQDAGSTVCIMYLVSWKDISIKTISGLGGAQGIGLGWAV